MHAADVTTVNSVAGRSIHPADGSTAGSRRNMWSIHPVAEFIGAQKHPGWPLHSSDE
jgi:hypothetical protein